MLYMESKTKSINSAIRLDDFEVYVRAQSYKNKINRSAEKLVRSIKWLPFTNRFDTWEESRILMMKYKKKT